MRSYRDFDLEIAEPERDAAGIDFLRLRVAASPAGEQRRAEAIRCPIGADLLERCRRLDRRELDREGLQVLGRDLGALLLPDPIRRYYDESLAALGDEVGLRLRLKIDAQGFADLPWEFSWLQPRGARGDGLDASGFLALDPRISIVRYELLNEPLPELDALPAPGLRMVGLFASPDDPRWPRLDLEGEENGLRSAIERRDGVELRVSSPPTLAALDAALLEGAQVFHFAGHGRFQPPIEDEQGSTAGCGFLIFCDEEGRADEVAADTLAVNLRSRGVRLAVLGACEGARRDRSNPWTGIAPALVRAGLPATVAMQATLFDRSAVAFATGFYASLAPGRPIDAAVSAGRLAVFNASEPGERDWGVPVLYLRAESGVLFPEPEPEEAEARPPEPLGWLGWLNAGLTAVALAALMVAFLSYAQPRLAGAWLWSGGLSLATLGGVVLGWLQWIAGDEARAWVRRTLRRLRTTAAVTVACVTLSVLATYLFLHRPIVLRVLPGAKLASHLRADGPTFSLTLRQGEGSEESTWHVESLSQSGLVVGCSERVAALALSRNEALVEDTVRRYLGTRGVPAGQTDAWLARLRPVDPGFLEPSPRRRNSPITVELTQGGTTIALQPAQIQTIKEAEDAIQVLFVEPSGNL